MYIICIYHDYMSAVGDPRKRKFITRPRNPTRILGHCTVMETHGTEARDTETSAFFSGATLKEA